MVVATEMQKGLAFPRQGSGPTGGAYSRYPVNERHVYRYDIVRCIRGRLSVRREGSGVDEKEVGQGELDISLHRLFIGDSP